MLDVKMKDLSIDDRKNKILEMLNREGKVKVKNLSRLFCISEVTVRSDLTDMESSGVLERMHGGAISTCKAYCNMSIYDRMKTNEAEKRRIAIEVASMISNGDTIMINSGTTTLFTVQELKNVKNLTIVTNSLSIAQEVGHHTNLSVILLGGSFNPRYQFTYGDDTINQLKKYNADKLILSADGISSENGVTIYHHLEAEVNKQMIYRVNKTIVVADFSKVGRASFARVDTLDHIDYLITDRKSNQEEIDAIKEKGIEVRVV